MRPFFRCVISLKILIISLYSTGAFALYPTPPVPYGLGPDSTNLPPVTDLKTIPQGATVAWVVRSIFLWEAGGTGWSESQYWRGFAEAPPTMVPGDPNTPIPWIMYTGAGELNFVAKNCPDTKPAWMICTVDRVWDKGRTGDAFQGVTDFRYSAPSLYATEPHPGYSRYYLWNGRATYRDGEDTGIYVQCTGYCNLIP